jgi:hypothetical protein
MDPNFHGLRITVIAIVGGLVLIGLDVRVGVGVVARTVTVLVIGLRNRIVVQIASGPTGFDPDRAGEGQTGGRGGSGGLAWAGEFREARSPTPTSTSTWTAAWTFGVRDGDGGTSESVMSVTESTLASYLEGDTACLSRAPLSRQLGLAPHTAMMSLGPGHGHFLQPSREASDRADLQSLDRTLCEKWCEPGLVLELCSI